MNSPVFGSVSPNGMNDTRCYNSERILEELSYNTNPFLNSRNDSKLSDETYQFLQKKLSDANESLSAYIERESNLMRKLEQLKCENEDMRCQNITMKSEIQVFRTRQISVDQKLENENRQKISMQEKISALEKDLEEERGHLKRYRDKLDETESKMIGTDHIAKKMYNLASDSCAQSDKLREEVHSLESLIGTCKSAMTKLSEEKHNISSKLTVIEKDYENYEGTMQDALSDIEILKEESRKQENYINDTLSRFKEISVHFESMKRYVSHQQEKLQTYQQELSSRNAEETKLKRQLESNMTEISSLQETTKLREHNLNHSISELEVKVTCLDTTRNALEKKNKIIEGDIQSCSEENIKLKSKLESMEMFLDKENVRCLEMKSLFDEEKNQREECQKQLGESIGKVNLLEFKVSEANGEREKFEGILANIKDENSKQKDILDDKRSEFKQATEENKKLRESLVRAQNQMACLQENVVDIERCLKERYSEYYQLQHNFQQVCQGKEILESDIEAKTFKMETMSKSCSDQETQIQSLQEKLKNCENSLKENEENYVVAVSKLKQLQQINNDTQTMNNKAYEAIEQLKDANNAELREKQNIQEQMRDIHEEFEKYKLLSENEKTRMTEEAKRIRMVIQGDQEEREKQRNAHEQAIFSLNKKLKEMADIIDTDREQIVKLQDRIIFLSNKNNDCLNETSRLQEQTEVKDEALKSFEFENKKLSKDLTANQDEMKNVKSELKEQIKEFEKFKEEVATYEKLWSQQQAQVLKEIQAELSSTSYTYDEDNGSCLLENI